MGWNDKLNEVLQSITNATNTAANLSGTAGATVKNFADGIKGSNTYRQINDVEVGLDDGTKKFVFALGACVMLFFVIKKYKKNG